MAHLTAVTESSTVTFGRGKSGPRRVSEYAPRKFCPAATNFLELPSSRSHTRVRCVFSANPTLTDCSGGHILNFEVEAANSWWMTHLYTHGIVTRQIVIKFGPVARSNRRKKDLWPIKTSDEKMQPHIPGTEPRMMRNSENIRAKRPESVTFAPMLQRQVHAMAKFPSITLNNGAADAYGR